MFISTMINFNLGLIYFLSSDVLKLEVLYEVKPLET